jgi:sarcosine oxidase subunit delta
MMQINCPWCGVRDEPEFICGGTTPLVRPELDCSDADWCSYLYMRDNPKGVHRERWKHAYGCGQWFNVIRNTVTHELLSTFRMGDCSP